MWSLVLSMCCSLYSLCPYGNSFFVCLYGCYLSLSLSMSVCGVSALFVVSGVGVYQYEPPVCVCVNLGFLVPVDAVDSS